MGSHYFMSQAMEGSRIARVWCVKRPCIPLPCVSSNQEHPRSLETQNAGVPARGGMSRDGVPLRLISSEGGMVDGCPDCRGEFDTPKMSAKLIFGVGGWPLVTIVVYR